MTWGKQVCLRSAFVIKGEREKCDDDTTSAKCVCPLKITGKKQYLPPKVLPLLLLFLLFCSVGYRHSSKKNTFFPRPPPDKIRKDTYVPLFVLELGRGKRGTYTHILQKKEERKKRLVASPPPIRAGNKNRMCSQRPAAEFFWEIKLEKSKKKEAKKP